MKTPELTAIGLLAAFAALSVLVCTGQIDGIDRAMLESVHRGASPTADAIWLKINWLGGPFFVAPATALIALIFAIRRQLRPAAIVVLGVGLSALLNLSLRHAFHRTRPVLWQSLILDHSFVFGYPGGHATLVAALASVLALSTRSRAVAVAGALYVLLIGYSSLYLGVHYPSDLVGGWILGYVVCWAVAQLKPLRAPTSEPAT